MLDKRSDLIPLSQQSEEVQNYFKEIADLDPYNLDMNGFFQRVIFSMDNNGLKATSDIYDLKIEILEMIKTK